MSDSEQEIIEVPTYIPPPTNYKRKIIVDSNPDVDITSLAMEKYQEFKQ